MEKTNRVHLNLSDPIQPLISSAVTAYDAWNCLNSRFASASRSRVISLKSKLVKNPKGNRTISEYLQDMKSIADDLALVQSPVSEEDLLVHILSQLGEEYGSIVAAIKIRETPLSYSELFDKLLDFERALKESHHPQTRFQLQSTTLPNSKTDHLIVPSLMDPILDLDLLVSHPATTTTHAETVIISLQEIVHLAQMPSVNFVIFQDTTLLIVGNSLGSCVTTTSPSPPLNHPPRLQMLQ